MLPLQAEAARYLAALRRQAQARGNALFKVSELFTTADTLDLSVPDMHAFIEELNYAGKHLWLTEFLAEHTTAQALSRRCTAAQRVLAHC